MVLATAAAAPVIICIFSPCSVVLGGAGAAASAGAAGGGAAAGGALGTAGSAIATGTSALVAAGPVGWAALGHDEGKWDCWKPILHDESSECSSHGRLLKEVVLDKRVKHVRVFNKENGTQELQLENQWGENFRIDFALLDGELTAHATKL